MTVLAARPKGGAAERAPFYVNYVEVAMLEQGIC